MLEVKPIRKVVGFISFVSALIWILLSLWMMVISWGAFEPWEHSLASQRTEMLELLQGLQSQLESLPDVMEIPVLENSIQQAIHLVGFLFSAMLGLLGIFKLLSLFLPVLVIFFLRLCRLFWAYIFCRVRINSYLYWHFWHKKYYNEPIPQGALSPLSRCLAE